VPLSATRAYLDHASTSPLRPVALDAMLPFLRDHHGDPGRLHAEGRATRVAIEEAREHVAAFLHARPREVVFTSSGTEAVNTAVWGAVARHGPGPHVVATAVEHSCVLDAARRDAAELSVAPVDRSGRVDPEAVLALVRADTALVAVQLANHEVGTIQPVSEITAACRMRGVLTLVDACAAAGHVPIDFAALAADLCALSAHKLGGPKGVGALLVRRGLRLPALLLGGAQERSRRAGLENVAAIVGFGAAAAELGDGALDGEAQWQAGLSKRVRGVFDGIDGVELFGGGEPSLPHITCFGVRGVEAEPILLALDQRGVAVHSGSSCSSEILEPSPVLTAMGVDAEHSLRVSVGWSSTDDDVAAFATAFPDAVAHLRALRTG
jgi:cysteine desulfurase